MNGNPRLPADPRLLTLRFSLRVLLIWITLLCGLMAIFVRIPLGSAVVIAGVALLLGAHVVGNALGTRLREQAAQSGEITETRLPARRSGSPHVASLPATSLRNKQRLSRTTPVVASIAAVLGAVVGGIALAWYNHPRGTLAGLVVGGLSCGFLGGFVGFLTGSFLEIFGPAWTEAAAVAPDPLRQPLPLSSSQNSPRAKLVERFSRPLQWLARR